MLAILPLLAYLTMFLALTTRMPDTDLRRQFVRACVLWGVYATLTAELLSLGDAITPLWLSVAWLVPTVLSAAFLLRGGRLRLLLARSRPRLDLPWQDGILLAGLVVILVAAGVVAWFAPPNTWDSLTYHMPRVAHWAQNGSLRPFATGTESQNGRGPGAEMLVLHFYVLAAGDRLVNFIGWFSVAGGVIGVSLIAAQLAGSRLAQLLGAVIAGCIPMAIIQASSTMTDAVVAFWMVCVASEGLSLWQGSARWDSTLFLSLAAGMAILTKATASAYLLPFAIFAAVTLLKRVPLREGLKRALVACTLVLALNLGQLTRNYAVYGSLLGVPEQVTEHSNELHTWQGLASNLLRHASIHAGTPWPDFNRLLYRGILKAHLLMGVDPNDPRTTSAGTWDIRRPTTEEATAGNSAHAYLFLLVGCLALAYRRKTALEFRIYTAAVLASFVVFCFLFKWQVFSGRYHLPFFVLFSPVAGLALGDWIPANSGRALAAILVVLSYPWVLSVQERPLLPLEGMAMTGSVLVEPRTAMYLYGDSQRIDAYETMALMVQSVHCSRVGVMLPGDSPEYVVWVVFGKPTRAIRIEWLVAGTPSARYRIPGFQPCAVICQDCPDEWTPGGGLAVVYDSPPFLLYLGNP